MHECENKGFEKVWQGEDNVAARGYTPVVLVKSAQTVERKGDELSLFAEE